MATLRKALRSAACSRRVRFDYWNIGGGSGGLSARWSRDGCCFPAAVFAHSRALLSTDGASLRKVFTYWINCYLILLAVFPELILPVEIFLFPEALGCLYTHGSRRLWVCVPLASHAFSYCSAPPPPAGPTMMRKQSGLLSRGQIKTSLGDDKIEIQKYYY